VIREVEVIKEVPVTLHTNTQTIKAVEMFREKAVLKTGNGKSGYRSEYLQIVEGIGPKIEKLLQSAGIKNWDDLAETSPDDLKEILENAGPRYKMHNPSTWPKQAQLAAKGKFDELNDYQDELNGGKE
jgi:predicted flap endonuclease-1-like 5' DNA nuclease